MDRALVVDDVRTLRGEREFEHDPAKEERVMLHILAAMREQFVVETGGTQPLFDACGDCLGAPGKRQSPQADNCRHQRAPPLHAPNVNRPSA